MLQNIGVRSQQNKSMEMNLFKPEDLESTDCPLCGGKIRKCFFLSKGSN